MILFVCSIVSLVVFSVSLLIVLIKTKFNVFYRMGYIYIAYMFSYICRFIMDLNRIMAEPKIIGHDVVKWLKTLNSFSSRTKWILIYYFVLQVREIKVRLSAQTP